MSKRGQLTLFIIIGLILLISLGLFFALRQPVTLEEPLRAPLEFRAAETIARDCIEQQLLKAATVVSAQGGYLIAPIDSFNVDGTPIGYGVDHGKPTLPSLESVENDITTFVATTLSGCVDGDALREQGYTFTDSVPDVTVDSSPTQLRAVVDWGARVGKASTQYTYGRVSGSLAIPYEQFYLSAASAADDARDGVVDISVLAADQFSHELLPHNTSHYLISTRLGNLTSENLIFLFAVRGKNLEPPRITVPQLLSLARDELRTLTVDVTDPDGGTVKLDVESAIATLSGNTLSIRSSVTGEYGVTINAVDDDMQRSSTTITVQVGG